MPEHKYGRWLTSSTDIAKLIVLTIVCTIVPLPFIMSSGFVLVIELLYLLILFMPPALGLMSLFYLVTRDPQKKNEYAGYGYLIGFAAGFFLLLSLDGSPLIVSKLPIPAIGFAIGIGFSFISRKPVKLHYGALVNNDDLR